MTPTAPGIQPSSADLGHEIDVVTTYTINPRTSVLVGYSHFFSGGYYNSSGLPHSSDADFLYAQVQLDFLYTAELCWTERELFDF